MNVPEKLTYQKVCNFLTGESNLTEIDNLEKKTPVYGIFRFMQENYTTLTQYSAKKNLTFYEAGKYLEKFLSGNLSKNDAYILTNALLYSERNFQKVNYLIEQHAEALDDCSNSGIYEHALSANDIVNELNKLKWKKTDNSFISQRNKIVTAILAVAAILLFLLILPFQTASNLDELYSFSKQVPLDYDQSSMRGSAQGKEGIDSAYNRYRFDFNKGMSEYLAQEYSNALQQWQVLEKKWAQIKSNPFFTLKDEQDFFLYNAVCRIALYLSADEGEFNKEMLLDQAIAFFEKLQLQQDSEQYFYALALALNGDKETALIVLSNINQSSAYYHRKLVLEEQLTH